MNKLFEFNWKRCPQGYECVEQNFNSSEARFIKPKNEALEFYDAYGGKFYGVSKSFAGLVDDDAVIKFARVYGLLGINSKFGNENLDSWYSWIKFFREIYDYIESNDRLGHAKALTFYNTPPEDIPVSPVLIPEVDEKSSYPVSKHRSYFYFRPHNLLAAMYVDLGERLTYGADLQKCVNPKCIRWFRRRANKLQCSDACKTEMCRARKRDNL